MPGAPKTKLMSGIVPRRIRKSLGKLRRRRSSVEKEVIPDIKLTQSTITADSSNVSVPSPAGSYLLDIHKSLAFDADDEEEDGFSYISESTTEVGSGYTPDEDSSILLDDPSMTPEAENEESLLEVREPEPKDETSDGFLDPESDISLLDGIAAPGSVDGEFEDEDEMSVTSVAAICSVQVSVSPVSDEHAEAPSPSGILVATSGQSTSPLPTKQEDATPVSMVVRNLDDHSVSSPITIDSEDEAESETPPPIGRSVSYSLGRDETGSRTLMVVRSFGGQSVCSPITAAPLSDKTCEDEVANGEVPSVVVPVPRDVAVSAASILRGDGEEMIFSPISIAASSGAEFEEKAVSSPPSIRIARSVSFSATKDVMFSPNTVIRVAEEESVCSGLTGPTATTLYGQPCESFSPMNIGADTIGALSIFRDTSDSEIVYEDGEEDEDEDLLKITFTPSQDMLELVGNEFVEAKEQKAVNLPRETEPQAAQAPEQAQPQEKVVLLKEDQSSRVWKVAALFFFVVSVFLAGNAQYTHLLGSWQLNAQVEAQRQAIQKNKQARFLQAAQNPMGAFLK